MNYLCDLYKGQVINDLTAIVSSINHLKNDIRAEVIAAEIIENGLNASDIILVPDGSFKRKYSKDVTHAEVIKSENGQRVLGIHLTRDGLYDSLPEALFHDQSYEPLTSGHEMAKLSKKQKREEKEARLFFLPFENEIFYHRIQVEAEERRILRRLSENMFDDIYPQFWKLDRSLPKKLVSRFVLILHLTHKILGNFDLTAKCLEVILEEDVKINLVRKPRSRDIPNGFNDRKTGGLGSAGLGEDFICGEYIPDSEPVMEFEIGPLYNSSIEDYLENGSYSRFLNCFYSFFVPVEVDAITTVTVSEAKQQFTLDDNHSNVILGYNAGI
jgi:hypothetical protein